MYVPTGADLREARTTRGLTQREITDRAGVSQPMLSRIETDDVDPRLSTLHRLVEAINGAPTAIDEAELEVAVPEALRELRTDAGLTQAALADRAGVSQPLIACIEGGDVDPRASTLRAILGELEPDDRQPADGSEPTSRPSGSETDILAAIESSFEQLGEES